MALHAAAIELLSESVIQKIAAGEVIERPASVVKELVENAIDAGATRIDISIEAGGFSLIQVADNGSGMSVENLARSILPHATSKIKNIDDLFSIGTMGFRGEALASIAAVSRITIASSHIDGGHGNSIQIDGGSQSVCGVVARSQGTTVQCRDLFFNVPARRKFMKSDRAEGMAVVRMLEQLCIGFPAIHFVASVDSKCVLEAPIAVSVRERIAAIAGAEFARTLVVCHGSGQGLELEVYISPPEDAAVRPRYQNMYVNLRRIDSDTALYAVREGYANFISSHLRPSFFCFITADPARIDVNVHPTKQKIKFDDERSLFPFVMSVVKQGLAAARPENPQRSVVDKPVPEMVPLVRSGSDPAGQQALFAPSLFDALAHEPTLVPFPHLAEIQKDLEAPVPATVQLGESEKTDRLWNLIPCFQLHDLLILAPIKNGVLLIDQHAAHERILFEQALEQLKQGRAESQQLLFPIVIELSRAEKIVAQSGAAMFARFGFEINDFGAQAISVSALPAFMTQSEAVMAVREMVQYLLDERGIKDFNEPEHRYAAAFACGAAIKAGKRLTHEEMNGLLNSLFSVSNPYICPHGRPTLIRISMDELLRRFLR